MQLFVSVELIHLPVILWHPLISPNKALESVLNTSWTGTCLFCFLVGVSCEQLTLIFNRDQVNQFWTSSSLISLAFQGHSLLVAIVDLVIQGDLLRHLKSSEASELQTLLINFCPARKSDQFRFLGNCLPTPSLNQL